MSSNTLDLIRSRQFWVFQLLGWSTWVVMSVLRDIIVVPPEYIFSRALVSGASAIPAMVLTAGLRSLYKLVWERGFVVRFLVAWFGSLMAALIWQPIRNYISFIPFGEVLSLGDASAEVLFDNLFSSSFPSASAVEWAVFYYQVLSVVSGREGEESAL